MLSGSWALAGGWMLAAPVPSSVTRRSRLVAPRATNPSAAERLKATMKGLVLKSFLPAGSKFTPAFMFSVAKASTSRVVSMTARQLCTFTLNRNGPFGEEQVLVT